MIDEERLDAAIDEAARQMTAGEPGGDFRARVQARIDSGSPARSARASFLTWRPAVASLAVLALLVAAVVLSRRSEIVVQQTATQGGTNAGTSQARMEPAPTQSDSRIPRTSEPPVDTTVAVRSLERTPRIARAAPAVASYTIEAPDGIDPIAGAPIDFEPIGVAALPTSEPLAIAPIQPAPSIAVAPIDIEQQGDRR